MLSNTTGNGNAALGRQSLASNTEGNYNTGLGIDALAGNTTGSYGVGIGQGALGTNTTGRFNTAVGPSADVASNNLTNATAIGNGAIVATSNTIQLGNTSITNVKTSGTITAGAVTYPKIDGSSGQVLTTDGSGVTSWTTVSGGSSSGVPYTGATAAVDLGAYNLKVNDLTIGKGGGNIAQNTALGNSSLGLNTTGTVNSAVGFESLKSNTTGAANTAFGSYALRQNQTGERNTAIGSQALQLTNGAYDNTAVGNLSAIANTTGSNNVALGSSSLSSNTVGSNNIAVGYEALRLNQADNNTASGNQAMRQNIGGGNNAAFGYTALYSNTNGSFNVAAGAQALAGNETGTVNVAIGAGAIDANTTGSYNTVLGGFAGRYIANGSQGELDGASDGASSNTIMDNSILIGAWTKPKANNETNQIVIGYNAIGNGSNTIQLGNTDVTNVKTSGTITAAGFSGSAAGLTELPLTTGVTGTLPVANGGTGAATLTANNVLLGNGTSALQAVAPGTSGNVLTSDGTTWTSAAASPTYSIGLNADLGGYVFYVTPNGKHGLVAAIEDASNSCMWYDAQNIISNPASPSYTTYGENFRDWRLPTLGEFYEMYGYKNVIGGFDQSPTAQYWTSVEWSYSGNPNPNIEAYVFYFNNGGINHDRKDETKKIRAIRSF
jgi:hypothetical protein